MEEDTMTAAPVTAPRRDQYLTLAASFDRHLAAENKSANTRKHYAWAISRLRDYLADRGMPREPAHIRREHVEAFLADVLAERSPATAAAAYRGLRVFFGWLVDEGEIQRSPMERMKMPAIPETPPAVLSDAQLARILKTVEGGRDFLARRDAAILRLLIDTGMRRAEIAGLALTDVDLDQRVAFVVGKGRRPRACPFGAKAARAIDRYLRVRDGHAHAAGPALWLGHKGPMTRDTIAAIVKRRAAEAGIPDVHPHLFRHAFAHAWLGQGGQEQDLMRLGGWRSRQVMARYGAAAADERAREAYRRLSPGDRL
jgi:site-specific recombinase XerD